MVPLQVGYMLFAKHKREEVKKTLAAGAPVTEVAKALGALWKKLPDVRPEPSQHFVAPALASGPCRKPV